MLSNQGGHSNTSGAAAGKATITQGSITSKNAKVGLPVQRGSAWHWGDQDGGEGGIGLLTTGDDGKGWAKVEWDHNGERRSTANGGA